MSRPVPMQVDLNCDLGEEMGQDDAILPFITSANVACGLHAGGPETMRRTIDAAVSRGVAVGAHPSLPDRAGFGRRKMDLSASQIADVVADQLGALQLIARRCGARLQHVKLHGALYQMAGDDAGIADAVLAIVTSLGPDVIVVGRPGSKLAAATRRIGLRFAGELFADRQYGDDGRLVARTSAGAVLSLGPAQLADRAVAMLKAGGVTSAGGSFVSVRGHTLCLHGDTPGAAANAQALSVALKEANIAATPMGAWVAHG